MIGLLLSMLALNTPLPNAQVCGPAAQVEVDSLEDQAFAAMKAAHEAVEKAARSEAVGTAGDAEWATYKALRARAEQARRNIARSGPDCDQVASSPSQAVAAAAAADSPPPPPLGSGAAEPVRRFRFSLATQIGKLDLDRRDRIQTETLNLALQDSVNRTIGQGPFGPILMDIPTALALPLGPSPQIALVSREPGVQLEQSIKAWSERETVGLEYRPLGFDAAGWRWQGTIAAETFTIKGGLPAPFAGGGYQVDGPSTFNGCGEKTCTIISRITPATTSAVIIGPNALQSLDLDSTRQVDTLFEATGGVANGFDVGGLRLAPGLAVSGGWWALDEDEVIAGKLLTGNMFLSRMQRKAEGPTVKVAASVALEGDEILRLPLRWSISGDYGVRWVNLQLHSRGSTGVMATEELTRSRSVAGASASLEYRFSPVLSVKLTADRREYVWLDTPLGNPANGVVLSDGSSAKLRKHGMSTLAARLQYDF